ncbi:MAG: penicillin-binding protein 1A [Alphaproteobacteria bacterium]|nr:penicillin-binding protein 1A [Alphaproteobacteria bacterium]MDE2631361.1 penicillin-binding protein 1A [Alphaproteobacteria bacterium]
MDEPVRTIEPVVLPTPKSSPNLGGWELPLAPDGFSKNASSEPRTDVEPLDEPPAATTELRFWDYWLGSWSSWRARAVVYGGLSAAVLLILAALGVVLYIWSVTRDLPSVEALQNYAPPVTTRVYAGDGTVIGEYARERRVFVPIAFVPKLVVEAFTSAEDRNFFNHPGVDPSGMLRAAFKDIGKVVAGRRPEGASTITQQVARNFLLNSDVRIARKIREVVLALRIDSTYSKEKVLELYLNEINLGQNSYGVAAAALNYFGKSLDDLDIAEVAFLAALPKAPSHYDPRFHHQAAVDRRNWVIGQMEENGYITEEQAKSAIAEPLNANTRPLGSQAEDANYFVEEVRRELYAKYGQQALYDGGLQVRSSLDTRLQNYAVNALRMGLVRYDRRHGWRGAVSNINVNGDWQTTLKSVANQSGIDTWRVAVVLGFSPDKSARIGLNDGTLARIPFSELLWARKEIKETADVGAQPVKPQDVVKIGDLIYVEALDVQPNAGLRMFGLRQVPEVNGGIVAMDPHTGRVLALSGGFSYASSQYDRAMQALRQPGSAFKPFVYAAALDNGFTPVAKVLDAPFVIQQGPGLPLWRPENFEKKFIGLATLRRGIELSKNLMTVRLAQAVGMDKIVPYADRFGVYDHLQPLLANALGSTATTLLRMTTGYAEFVNGGKKITPSLIDRIQDRNGKTIWRHDARPCEGCNDPNWHGQAEPLLADTREQIMDPNTAYQIVSLLQGVVERGTGRSVLAVGKPLAGKTGTSNESKDTWFVGFSPDLACGVYVGFDNPRTLGRLEQGATVAAPVFRDFMKGALADVPPTPFRVPPGIEFVPVDHLTGAVVAEGTPGAIEEAFKSGTAPGDPGAPPQIVIGGDTPAGPNTTTPSQVGEGTGGLY